MKPELQTKFDSLQEITQLREGNLKEPPYALRAMTRLDFSRRTGARLSPQCPFGRARRPAACHEESLVSYGTRSGYDIINVGLESRSNTLLAAVASDRYDPLTIALSTD